MDDGPSLYNLMKNVMTAITTDAWDPNDNLIIILLLLLPLL
jgi:hypothetical protein